MRANPDIALLGAWALEIDLNGQAVGMIQPSTEPDQVHLNMLRANQFVHASVMMKKEVVEAERGYDEDLNSSEDYDLFSRISDRYQCANIPQALCIKRVDWQHEAKVHKLRRRRHMQVKRLHYQRCNVGFMAYMRLAPTFLIWCLPGRFAVGLRRLKRRVGGTPTISNEITKWLDVVARNSSA
jgi:hypothetical protein